MRCCVYKERAIVSDRVKLAMGGDKENPNVIEVIETACDECPMGGYEVTNSCRGCLAHRCEDVCRRGAISFDHNHTAHIDKSKCVDCGACAKVCPYTAIINRKRPCESACKIKAISMNEDKAAKINNDKCIACGACVYQCPFGAIMDKSFILDVIDIIKKSENNSKYKVFAVVAPSISSQFTYAKLGQVITGLKELGFHTVVEAALGADMVAYKESAELAEKGFLTSSCCPAFVSYIEKAFPDMLPLVSHNLSPMAEIAKYIKEHDAPCKVVFIGPCTAKKAEVQKENVKPYVDAAITFEELQALFDSKDIDITTLNQDVLDNASYFGRIFARSGGLSDAVAQGLKEQNITDFELKAVACDGIEECRTALLKKSKNVLNGNFIEGMACKGGCIGGAGCLTHGEKNKAEVDKYGREVEKCGREAYEKSISEAISIL
ncbi:iron only hydrogenase large subunit C-terminal domain [Ruminococcus sp. CAG:624]|nr:iron only hydrogenase large subunit C-terminal domain [Ruminococcus sp. CAG:624]